MLFIQDRNNNPKHDPDCYTTNHRYITKWLEKDEITQWWIDQQCAYVDGRIAINILREFPFQNTTKIFPTSTAPEKVVEWIRKTILAQCRVDSHVYDLERLASIKSLYCLSSVKPSIPDRPVNKHDIDSISYVVFDLDTMTDGSRITEETALEVLEWMKPRLGENALTLYDSGNGWHVVCATPEIKIDPFDDDDEGRAPQQHHSIIRGLNDIADALTHFFDVRVDRVPLSVKNSLRIPGTPNTKRGKIKRTIQRPPIISPWRDFWFVFAGSGYGVEWSSSSTYKASGKMKDIFGAHDTNTDEIDIITETLTTILGQFDGSKVNLWAMDRSDLWFAGSNQVPRRDWNVSGVTKGVVKDHVKSWLIDGSEDLQKGFRWKVKERLGVSYRQSSKVTPEDVERCVWNWVTLEVRESVLDDLSQALKNFLWWKSSRDAVYAMGFVGVLSVDDFQKFWSGLEIHGIRSIQVLRPFMMWDSDDEPIKPSTLPLPLAPSDTWLGLDLEHRDSELTPLDALRDCCNAFHHLGGNQAVVDLDDLSNVLSTMSRDDGFVDRVNFRFRDVQDSKEFLKGFETDSVDWEPPVAYSEAWAPLMTQGNNWGDMVDWIKSNWKSVDDIGSRNRLLLKGDNSPLRICTNLPGFDCSDDLGSKLGHTSSETKEALNDSPRPKKKNEVTLPTVESGKRWEMTPKLVEMCAVGGMSRDDAFGLIVDHLTQSESNDWRTQPERMKIELEKLIGKCYLFDVEINAVVSEERRCEAVGLSDEDFKDLWFGLCRKNKSLMRVVWTILTKALPWRKGKNWFFDLPYTHLVAIDGANMVLPGWLVDEVNESRMAQGKQKVKGKRNPWVILEWMIVRGLLSRNSGYRKGKCRNYRVNYLLKPGNVFPRTVEFDLALYLSLSDQEIKESFERKTASRLIQSKYNALCSPLLLLLMSLHFDHRRPSHFETLLESWCDLLRDG